MDYDNKGWQLCSNYQLCKTLWGGVSTCFCSGSNTSRSVSKVCKGENLKWWFLPERRLNTLPSVTQFTKRYHYHHDWIWLTCTPWVVTFENYSIDTNDVITLGLCSGDAGKTFTRRFHLAWIVTIFSCDHGTFRKWCNSISIKKGCDTFKYWFANLSR